MEEVVTFSPLGILGYGIPEESVKNAQDEYEIDVVAIDGGSVDAGPNYLGQDISFTNEEVVKRDLELLLDLTQEEDAPLLVGTAGGAGSKAHLNLTANYVEEIAEKYDTDLDVVKIYTDVERRLIKQNIENDEVGKLSLEEELTSEKVDDAENIVAQIGVNPFINALEKDPDLVISGRSLDVAPFAAVPIKQGMDKGLAYHFGKVMECGSQATETGSGSDSLVGIMTDDYFDLVPPNPDLKCTVESVAAHTLYEKADPYTIYTTDGETSLVNSEFEQVDERRVRVSGSEFKEHDRNSVLIEGVEKEGYRTITPAGMCDPTLIENIDDVLEGSTKKVENMAGLEESQYTLDFRRYGLDGTNLYESNAYQSGEDPDEIGVIIDALGETQEIANTVCELARSTLLHHPFEERVAIAGNLAFPFSPHDIPTGPVYNFSIYHLLENTRSEDVVDQEEVVL